MLVRLARSITVFFSGSSGAGPVFFQVNASFQSRFFWLAPHSEMGTGGDVFSEALNFGQHGSNKKRFFRPCARTYLSEPGGSGRVTLKR